MRSNVSQDDDMTALVMALRRNDAGAAAELFDRFAPAIRRTLARIIGSDNSESSDLLHDTFLRAVQRLHQLRNPAALAGWLQSVAAFRAREWLRARKRMELASLPAATTDAPAVLAPPEARQAVGALYQLVDRLPEKERVIFQLRFVEQRKLAEIAGTCRASVSTIKRRIQRVERRVRKALPAFPALAEHVDVALW
jgi:RNA polymerase sigma-70 factor, ECF subfamily